MILGEFTADQAQVIISVSNGRGDTVQVTAIIDTGFIGSLLLPRSLADQLQLLQIDQEELAFWQEEQRIVPAHVADGDVLIGIELLRGNIGTIEFIERGSVTIESAD